MRRFVLVAAAAAAVLLCPLPANARPASPPHVDHPWTPAPSAPYDREAGVLCDFAIHVEPVVDQVRRRVLATYPDGSVRREVYVGPLVLRVTNTDAGKSTDVDASGNAVVSYRPGGVLDRDSTWHAVGPAVFGYREGRGDRPRGLYRFDGVYTVRFDETGFKTVTVYAGTETEICALIA